MPRYPRLTRPCVRSGPRISLATLMGTAKPMPWPWTLMAELMPMASPAALTRGPPEFPGLMAASVWM